MIDTNLWADGLVVMGLGVGFVLSFLVLMIIAMYIMAHIIGYLNKLFPVAASVVATPKKAVKDDSEESIAVAILSAILKK